MKRSTLKRGSPLPRSSSLSKGTKLRHVGKRGRAIRSELEKVRPLVFERDGNLCRRCKDPLCTPLDVHHRRARSQGGTHTLDNLVLLCRQCHTFVTDHRAPDWREWITTARGRIGA